MRKRILYLFLVVLLFGLMGCSGETTTVETTTVTPTTEISTTEAVSEDEIIIVLGEDNYTLGYNDDSMSVLDLIEASDIHLAYTTSDYGAMLTEIGDYKADTFHWIGFTKNDEFAMEGLGQIAYEDGDVFEFTENFSNWEMTIDVTYDSSDDTYAYFTLGDYQVNILLSEITDVLFENETYSVTMTPQSMTEQEVLGTSSTIEPESYDVINDFTELYTLEINEVFFLEFTVTSYEGSSAFGYELFAEDINGLSSTLIFPEMPYPSQSEYIFYTIPDAYTLDVGTTYIGRFIYQINDPSTIAQITLFEEGLPTAIIEK